MDASGTCSSSSTSSGRGWFRPPEPKTALQRAAQGYVIKGSRIAAVWFIARESLLKALGLGVVSASVVYSLKNRADSRSIKTFVIAVQVLGLDIIARSLYRAYQEFYAAVNFQQQKRSIDLALRNLEVFVTDSYPDQCSKPIIYFQSEHSLYLVLKVVRNKEVIDLIVTVDGKERCWIEKVSKELKIFNILPFDQLMKDELVPILSGSSKEYTLIQNEV